MMRALYLTVMERPETFNLVPQQLYAIISARSSNCFKLA